MPTIDEMPTELPKTDAEAEEALQWNKSEPYWRYLVAVYRRERISGQDVESAYRTALDKGIKALREALAKKERKE